MKLTDTIRSVPFETPKSNRHVDIVGLTSCRAGTVVPVAYEMLLREDRVSKGHISLNIEMMETAETLRNAISVTAHAVFVPFLAFDRFNGIGRVMMNERELNRVEVLAQADDGPLSIENAANVLALTRRQIFRLLKRYRQDGASAIRHKARGKPPNNCIHSAKRDHVLSVIKKQHPDFGPTLAAEKLAEHQGFPVSREILRKWTIEAGRFIDRACVENAMAR